MTKEELLEIILDLLTSYPRNVANSKKRALDSIRKKIGKELNPDETINHDRERKCPYCGKVDSFSLGPSHPIGCASFSCPLCGFKLRSRGSDILEAIKNLDKLLEDVE